MLKIQKLITDKLTYKVVNCKGVLKAKYREG